MENWEVGTLIESFESVVGHLSPVIKPDPEAEALRSV